MRRIRQHVWNRAHQTKARFLEADTSRCDDRFDLRGIQIQDFTSIALGHVQLAGLPNLPQARWACSCKEIDWRAAGFEGRTLGWLCSQAGWFFDAHRAEGDVDAVIAMLSHERTDGRTFMWELDASSSSDSWLIEATGSAISTKDALRMRGYHWNPKEKVWWREVFDRDLISEQAWLGREIYGPEKLARAMGPQLTRLTAYDRYRRQT